MSCKALPHAWEYSAGAGGARKATGCTAPSPTVRVMATPPCDNERLGFGLPSSVPGCPDSPSGWAPEVCDDRMVPELSKTSQRGTMRERRTIAVKSKAALVKSANEQRRGSLGTIEPVVRKPRVTMGRD